MDLSASTGWIPECIAMKVDSRSDFNPDRELEQLGDKFHCGDYFIATATEDHTHIKRLKHKPPSLKVSGDEDEIIPPQMPPRPDLLGEVPQQAVSTCTEIPLRIHCIYLHRFGLHVPL